MTRYAATLLTLSLAAGAASAAVKTEVVEYEHAGTKLKGFVAYDDAVTGKRPGVLVFPEWWGLNDYAKSRAKQLAGLGYVAFAADLYGDGKVIDIAHPDDAQKMAMFLRANQDVWRGRAQAAFKQLTGRPNVDASKVAAIGYCLGGSTALQLAFTGADLKAVTTFHAALPTPTPAEAAAVKAKVLVCHGGADPAVPMKAVDDLKAALGASKTALEVVVYPGVVHSFTAPDADKVGRPAMKYDKTADEDSWRRMSALFRQELGR
ncbi:dienelactone hydrolase family protein [bacterium]|nr:dienelactone hydrolase family protein [bacterium]